MLRFWLFSAAAALLLMGLQNAVFAQFMPRPAQEWVYTARLAVGAAVLVSTPWTLLYALEQALGRFAGLTGLIVIACVAPVAQDLAHHLAGGDGVAALRIAPQNLERVGTAVFCIAALFVWAFEGARLSLRYYLPWGALVLAALLFFDYRYLRTYGMLAPFVLVSAVYIATGMLQHIAMAFACVRAPMSILAAVSLLVLVGLGSVKPGWLVLGRSRVLADENSTVSLDLMLFGDQLAAVQFDLALAAKQPCVPTKPAARWPTLAIAPEKRRNVILISVDALRRDMVGKRVNGRSLTPNLDRFAQESWVAKHAYTSYPATLFALGGAVTGLLPSEIMFAPEPPDTIFRVLKPHVSDVFATLPTSGWFALPAFSKYVTQSAQRIPRMNALAQTDDVLRRLNRLRASKTQHVGWVHYLEPHAPYEPHEGFAFGADSTQLYYGEIAYLDAQIGRLLDRLREGGWYDDSLIVFFADHGEALGERQYHGHHVFLNGWISNIPLMIHAPGIAPRHLTGSVSITDVAPTVLHFLDQAPPTQLSGQSLLTGSISPDRVVVSEAFPIRGQALFDVANTPLQTVADLSTRIDRIQNKERGYQPKVSIVRGRYRLIVRRASGAVELFDLEADPTERHNLAGERPDLVETMMAQMAAWHRAEAARFYCAVRALPPPAPPPVVTPTITPMPRAVFKGQDWKMAKPKPKSSRSQH